MIQSWCQIPITCAKLSFQTHKSLMSSVIKYIWHWFTEYKQITRHPMIDLLPYINMKSPGGRLNKKDGLTRYGNSHVKDVLSLTWKSPYVDKTVFILRRGPWMYPYLLP